MKPAAATGPRFTLNSGRLVYIDLLVIEPLYAHRERICQETHEVPLLMRRRGFDVPWPAWYEPDELHFMEPFPARSDGEERALATALLWSAPISEAFAFSELLVAVFIDWRAATDLHVAIRDALRGLDWEALARDWPVPSASPV